MSKAKIKSFTLHNDRGQSVLSTDLLRWKDELNHPTGIFGPVIKYTWSVNGRPFESPKTGYWQELPDSSGFICFESRWEPDNCVLLDACGKERMRLTVPWQMTGATDPQAGEAPTSFDNISEPCLNPETGQPGKFGVTAHVAGFFGCKFYFELDYHSGQFLWCRRIRD
jgi:hypothetical protein